MQSLQSLQSLLRVLVVQGLEKNAAIVCSLHDMTLVTLVKTAIDYGWKEGNNGTVMNS